MYKEARELFIHPNVESDIIKLNELIKWDKPHEEGLKEFLVNQKKFSDVKVDNGLKKLKACQGKQN